jgi:multisubunit Na+/H+ antiporter MnhG subunit
MDLISLIISLTACFLLFLSAIAFLRAKDIFVMTHIVMIANSYIIPLLIIGLEIKQLFALSFAKIIVVIILNLVITNLICHLILRRAIINKIIPNPGNYGSSTKTVFLK